jgi:(p)ppGpp synthase/HD superfamily hydrolase
MSNLLGKAIAIASEGFKNKTDKSGKPYILHCIRVMQNLHTQDEELMSIAILHDCVEDKVCTILELASMGFSQRVIIAVGLLTHDQAVPYQEYIKNLSWNYDAVKVKLSDLRDNSNITRLKGLTKSDFDRMEKYHIAYTYLSKI